MLTDRQTDRQTHTQTDRQTDGHKRVLYSCDLKIATITRGLVFLEHSMAYKQYFGDVAI